MTRSKPIQIVLLTGYLGAGKTTLLNHILANEEGIRAAVIVNDIGEVNVDASLIARDGVSEMDGNLIPLTNGCLCCTLSDDLARQLGEIAADGAYDYLFIEASGICEPIPIAYTLSAFCEESEGGPAPMRLDNIVAVVDCRRMHDEFAGGSALLSDDIEEDDIESLLVQQIEFCTTLVLNKASEVSAEELAELKAIVRSLQKDAVMVEADYADMPMGELLNTGRFDFERAYASAAWQDAMEHPEEHDDPEMLEYGISTFVYRRRRPFSLDALNAYAEHWPDGVVRAKGIMWVADDPDTCYLFEQAGRQMTFEESGPWIAAAPADERERALAEYPDIAAEWDDECGDRMNKICFIGRHLDRAALEAGLDGCLQ